MSTDLVIDLDAPQDGVVPKAPYNLHEEQLQEAVRLIRRLAVTGRAKRLGTAPVGAAVVRSKVLPTRRGLLIEGERGIGKTSFLYALCEFVNNEDRVPHEDKSFEKPRVHALPLLDPSLISGDRTFIAAVIANILAEVELCLGHQNSCDPRLRDQRQALDKALKALHGGLIAEAEDTWRGLTARDAAGHQFVDHLLQMAKGGIDLAERFEAYCRSAADLLGADMLLQPLDDVDLAGPEAYTTLEAVRRYMTGPSLLPVVAGDLQQFIGVVWERRLAEEKRGLKAREGQSAAHRQFREGELHVVALQHLDKLLPVHHHFPLESPRSRALADGRCHIGAEVVPVLGNMSETDAPLRRDCLVGRAELALVPSPGLRVTGALLPLLPPNTRRLFSTLRLLRDSLHDEQSGLAERRASAISSLRRLGRSFSLELLEFGLRPQDLPEIAGDGPQETGVNGLKAMWQRISGRLLGPHDEASPAAALLTIALAQWMAQRPCRALVLLGMHAPYLSPWPGSRPVLAGPRAVADRVSAAGQALAAAVVAEDADYAEVSDVMLPRSEGLVLRSTSWKTNSKNRGFRSVMAALHDFAATEFDELAPYYFWQRSTAEAAETIGTELRGLFLKSGRLLKAGRVDAAVALRLARTFLPSSSGRMWMVDPCRTVEAAARLLVAVEAAPLATGRYSLTTELLRLYQDDRMADLGDQPGLKVGDMATEQLTGGGLNLNLNQLDLVEHLYGWARAASKRQIVPAVPSVALAHRRWQRALADVSQEYLLGLPTVGGYLQRSTLSLFASAIETELRALRDELTSGASTDPRIQEALRAVDVESDAATVFEVRPPASEGATSEPDWRPAGRLTALISLVLVGAQRASASPATWAEEQLPLSTMLVTCPLLWLHLSAQWRARLRDVWSVSEPSLPDGHPDVFTLLSGIPIPPFDADGPYIGVADFETKCGVGILSLSPNEERGLRELSQQESASSDEEAIGDMAARPISARSLLSKPAKTTPKGGATT
jgi:hypothetical protein